MREVNLVQEVVAVVLAAGKGVRMRSRWPKVMHKVAGIPMVKHVVKAVRECGVGKIVLVVGHGRDLIARELAAPDIHFVLQEEQLGTGHALMMAEEVAKKAETVLVVCGDTPLIRSRVLNQLLAHHRREGAAATVLTAVMQEPTGYGRVIRDDKGYLVRIVEEKDASAKEKSIKEVNSGIYCFSPEVFQALRLLRPDNAQGEYYLTDVLPLLKEMGRPVQVMEGANEEEVYGINDRVQLAYAERVLRQRKNEEIMLKGVTIIDPYTTYIDAEVEVGQDTILYPFTFLKGKTVIGQECQIGPGAVIVDSVVEDETVLENSKVVEARIGKRCSIGPFAYIRPGTVLEDEVKVGDFVEIKKSQVGKGSKIPHLSYIGDARLGSNVNIGAGTITCNYDGQAKHESIIEDDAFIGSNTNLVAPVRVGKGATTGAGSTITKDVPPFSLAVERAEQRLFSDWGKKKKRD